MPLLLLTCATRGKRGAVFKPLADEPCFGQKPCLHTTASERIESGCANSVWKGAWQNEQVASHQKTVVMGKKTMATHLGVSNRFEPASSLECDIADLLLLSPSAEVEKSLTDAKLRHLLTRLQGLRNKLWLTVGTSVDHRVTHHCPLIAGTRPRDIRSGDDVMMEFCVLERLNFTIMYTFRDGFSTTVSSRNATLQQARFSLLKQCLQANGWPHGPDFLTLAGVEWDFKHWFDAKADPDFEAVFPAIHMQSDIARRQWPSLSGLFLRTQYSSNKYLFDQVQVECYNQILHHFQDTTKKYFPCGSIFVADMALLMRHNGSAHSGWTDGLHPAAWVTLQYISMSANVLSDLGELCSESRHAAVSPSSGSPEAAAVRPSSLPKSCEAALRPSSRSHDADMMQHINQ